MADRYLTVTQAGEAFPALGERYIRRLIAERRIAFSKVGARVLLRADDIEALIDDGRVEPAKVVTRGRQQTMAMSVDRRRSSATGSRIPKAKAG